MRVEDRPPRGRFWLARALASGCAKLAFRWGAQRDHPAENLDLDAWDRAAVEPAINGLEQLADGRSIGSREVAHRKLDRDLVALAAVAHEGGALLNEFGGGRTTPHDRLGVGADLFEHAVVRSGPQASAAHPSPARGLAGAPGAPGGRPAN